MCIVIGQFWVQYYILPYALLIYKFEISSHPINLGDSLFVLVSVTNLIILVCTLSFSSFSLKHEECRV